MKAKPKLEQSMQEEQIRAARKGRPPGKPYRDVGREALANLEWEREVRLGCRRWACSDAEVGHRCFAARSRMTVRPQGDLRPEWRSAGRCLCRCRDGYTQFAGGIL